MLIILEWFCPLHIFHFFTTCCCSHFIAQLLLQTSSKTLHFILILITSINSPNYVNPLFTLFYRSLGNKLCVTGLSDSMPLRRITIYFHTLFLSFSKSAADLMILHLRLTYFSSNAFGKGQTHLLEKHVSL